MYLDINGCSKNNGKKVENKRGWVHEYSWFDVLMANNVTNIGSMVMNLGWLGLIIYELLIKLKICVSYHMQIIDNKSALFSNCN